MDRTDSTRAGRPAGILSRFFAEVAHNWRVFISAARGAIINFSVENTPAIFIFTRIPRYTFQAAFFVLLARVAGGEELMRFALLGNAIQIAVNMGLINMTSTVESEKWLGTLPVLIAVPSHKLPALLGRGVESVLEAVFGITIALTAGMLLFSTTFPLIGILRAVPVIALLIVSVVCMGLWLGAIMLPMRIGTLTSNLLAYVMMILCGINFPVDALPGFLQIAARFFPVTSGLQAVRAIVDGARYGEVGGLIGVEVLVALAYLITGTLIFDARLRHARQTGRIEEY